VAPLSDLLAAGVHVGLGVDGSASNEAGGLVAELHQSLLVARGRGGPQALDARQALALGTIGGARCLGRETELGSLEPGKLADVALWRVDGLTAAGLDDPVASLVFGTPTLEALYVGGRPVVTEGVLVNVDEGELAKSAAAASATLRRRAGMN
jgi:cytosine/adenosine deaminase-related metal-dependent hydrolase